MINLSKNMRKSENTPSILKFLQINWILIFLIFLLCTIGIIILYSAGKTTCPVNIDCVSKFGSWSPWASSQISKLLFGFILMFIISVISLKFWIKYAYYIYGFSVLLLIGVLLFGHTGMGAQRWINLGIRIQPSEIMKISLVLALSKYFAGLNLNEIQNNYYLIFPFFLILVPVALVLKQPDLGTAMTLIFTSAFVLFISGVQKRKFLIVALIGMITLPFVWQYGLHNYQKQRIIIFLNPEKDIMGSGYHITQSKISLGSGGVFGKGYLKGTQSHLNFLPEKHTDFIFTMFAEEFGFIGSLLLFTLIFVIIYECYKIAFNSRNSFGKLLSLSLASNFFIYFLVNTSMVLGLIPVVGVPFPLLSYGGTASITLLIGFGLIQSAHIHGDMIISSKGDYL